jgi:hypothetical protein
VIEVIFGGYATGLVAGVVAWFTRRAVGHS